jgi:hypothetical protein
LNVKVDRLVVFTAVSWFGLWVHELHRVPSLLGFTPDGDLFMLAIAARLAYWWQRSRSTSAAAALLAYGLINLAGGTQSVLPLGWLPFQPAQTLSHYAVHAVYAACQVPLIAGAALQLRRPAAAAR